MTIGFLLNTKGLVELVVLNVGLDIGVLTKEIFAAFVVMAIWYLPPSCFFVPLPVPIADRALPTQEHHTHHAHRVAVVDPNGEEAQPHDA